MPFDKNSFLRGVITGMRLPRTPGKVPPFTPVSSGKYILMESGERIIMERPDDPDGIIMNPGVWYKDANAYPDMYYRMHLADGVNDSDFFWLSYALPPNVYGNRNANFMFVISPRIIEIGLVGYLERAVPIPRPEYIDWGVRFDTSQWLWSREWSLPGKWYAYPVGAIVFADVNPIEGVNSFVGTAEEFRSFLGEVKYMITEQR